MEMIAYKDMHKWFDYKKGELIWQYCDNSARNGRMAGSLCDSGYIKIKIHKKQYYAHRLVWLWHHGYLPEKDIDHINQNKSDNRIENLREVSRSCNLRNSKTPKHNTSGVKGVCWNKSQKKWEAQITVNSKTKYAGGCSDFDEAVLLRLAVEQCLGWVKCGKISSAYQYAVKHKLLSVEYEQDYQPPLGSLNEDRK